MDSLRLGMLLPGGRPGGDGINHAQRAPVLTRQGEVMAIVKELPLTNGSLKFFVRHWDAVSICQFLNLLLVIDPAQQLW
ncbi:MAG: hypothetical protein IPL99_26290 [Candidatus Competibacteraceae bacterium]|nr:hypothetical protein [Candidatus Competibacteraceae bacterium]